MRKLLFIIVFALTTNILLAQIVNIPDANFKSTLLTYTPKIDLNDDKEIQVSEAIIVNSLTLNGKSIKDLTGIEFFTSLTYLDCSDNQLSILELGMNVKLKILACFANQLKELDVSKNNLLIDLLCYSNLLTKLDLSNNINLDYLLCHSNFLYNLDVSLNINLTAIACYSNLITSLDVRKNTNLIKLECYNNPNLAYVCISGSQIDASKYWSKDALTQWNFKCALMTNLEEGNDKLRVKKLIRIITPLGQELKPEQANEGIFIYLYDDGSITKLAK